MTEKRMINSILDGEVALGEVLSRKKKLSREEYLSWLQKEVEAVHDRDRTIKREAFTIAEEDVRRAIHAAGFDPVDFDDDELKELERVAAGAVEKNPEITKEAERRHDARSEALRRQDARVRQLANFMRTLALPRAMAH